jgi:alkanesulfonate monooxygenase SsuD/methylene tetrahydromethanopterin reductase-like flavin-dependent oxidoreductase (luciferase family)
MRIGFWPPVYGNWIMTDQPGVGDASFDYTRRATLLAERLGFDTLLLAEHFIHPNGAHLDLLDAWSTASALAALTERIEILAAVKPGLRAPGVIAKMASNIDHISNGRFAINLVSAWWLPEYEMLGTDVLAHDERYARSEEFITIIKGLWTETQYSFEGKYFQLRDATIAPKPLQKPCPPIYIGGESEQGRSLGARVADIFLINGRPEREIAEIVSDMRQRASNNGRTLRYGMSAFVVCRETEAEAQAEFERLLALRHVDIRGADKEVVMLRTTPDVGDRLGTNGGTAAGLVGTPEQIASRMQAFGELGIETFLLQFHPVLEELERFGETVLPLLAGARKHVNQTTGSGHS